MINHFESETSHENISDEELEAYERDEPLSEEVTSGVQRILAATSSYANPDPFTLEWGEPGTGCGQARFYYSDHENGKMKLYCDNECMSKEFIKRMLCQMVDDSTFTEE